MTNKEITMSISIDYMKYSSIIEREISRQINEVGQFKTIVHNGRIYYKTIYKKEYEDAVKHILQACIIDIYLSLFKRAFILRRAPLHKLSSLSKDILLETLQAFGYDYELKLMSSININDLNIEGYYNFAMSEIKARWQELSTLVCENLPFLYDENIFNDLVKFLISGINSRVKMLKLMRENNGYRLKTIESKFSYNRFNTALKPLLLESIRLAPEIMQIDANIPNSRVLQKFRAIFTIQ